ncbi:BolA/IbaG family iron-sulfur metabolism protein [Candidatus Peregrinibacteria bacterium]|nr:BolA/IbaG family iron-sulfur metabolism protein [Candidatus Peregrinibacteria bacterium]
MENEVRKRLIASFPEAEIAIDFADGKHMTLEIQAKEFSGKTLLEQHGMVNAVLADLFADGSLHALKLKTRIK